MGGGHGKTITVRSRTSSPDPEIVQKVSGFLDGLGHPVALLDSDGRILNVNRPFLRLTNYPTKDLKGSSLTEFIHELYILTDGRRCYMGTNFLLENLVNRKCEADLDVLLDEVGARRTPVSLLVIEWNPSRSEEPARMRSNSVLERDDDDDDGARPISSGSMPPGSNAAGGVSFTPPPPQTFQIHSGASNADAPPAAVSPSLSPPPAASPGNSAHGAYSHNPVWRTGSPTRSPRGSIAGQPNPMRMFLVFIQNASEELKERQRLKQSLLKSELKRKAVIDTSVDGVIVCDTSGMIRSFNRAACRLFRYADPSDVIGKSVNMLMPKQYADNHDRYIQNYLETGIRHVIGVGREVPALRSDGTEFPCGLTVSDTCDIDGHHLFVGILRDRSIQKLAEKVLYERKEWIEQITKDHDEHVISIGEDGSVYDKAHGLSFASPSRVKIMDPKRS